MQIIRSKKRRLVKDKNYRNNFKKLEFKRLLTKYNTSLHFLEAKYKNYLFFIFMKNFHINASLCRFNSICIVSGRAH
jgi:hypothetical protein